MHDDLKRRLRDEVDTELGVRPASDLSDVLRRGRGKRLGNRLMATVSMVLVGTAVVAGGLWIDRTISSPSEDERTSIQPADDEPSPSEPIPCETPESDDHAGRRCLIGGEVRFRIVGGWAEQFESRITSAMPRAPETLLLLDNAAGTAPMATLFVVTDPAPLEALVDHGTHCSRAGATPISAEAFAAAIQGHAGLDSSDPITERIGGVDALRLDMTPVADANMCAGFDQSSGASRGVPVLTGTRDVALGSSLVLTLPDGMRMRLYLIDLPDGRAETLGIAITAAEGNFDAAEAAAAPLLNTFQFHGRSSGS